MIPHPSDSPNLLRSIRPMRIQFCFSSPLRVNFRRQAPNAKRSSDPGNRPVVLVRRQLEDLCGGVNWSKLDNRFTTPSSSNSNRISRTGHIVSVADHVPQPSSRYRKLGSTFSKNRNRLISVALMHFAFAYPEYWSSSLRLSRTNP
jgi:hypothetical protein